MPYQLTHIANKPSLAEREQGLARIPLVRAILNEIDERSRRVMILEAARAALSLSRADSAVRNLHECEASVHRRELRRAECELAQLGCSIAVNSPLTIQMILPSGVKMLWILGF